MGTSVVAISYLDGAGGSRIGQLVAEGLGFRYVDEEIVELAVSRIGTEPALLTDAVRRKGWLERVLDTLGHVGVATALLGESQSRSPVRVARADDTGRLIQSAIEEVAARGDVVIVAHAASIALGPRAGLLRVLVVAPTEVRVRRLIEQTGSSEEEVRADLERSDAARADYLLRLHGVEAELPIHFDLVVNTESLEPETAARLILEAARPVG
jgi:cytidylate kinase